MVEYREYQPGRGAPILEALSSPLFFRGAYWGLCQSYDWFANLLTRLRSLSGAVQDEMSCSGPSAQGSDGINRVGGQVPWGAEVAYAYLTGYVGRGRLQ